MTIPPFYDLMRDWTTYIPQRMDGSGVVGLHMRAGSMQHFKLDKFPRPKDHGITYPDRNAVIISMPPRKRGANNGTFRLAYKYSPGRDKPHACRFRLSGKWRVETLQVITDYLNSGDVPWLYLTNYANNRANLRCFTSTVGYGKS